MLGDNPNTDGKDTPPEAGRWGVVYATSPKAKSGKWFTNGDNIEKGHR